VGVRGSKSVLLTLTNRNNNDEIMIKIPDRTRNSVVSGLNKLEAKLGTQKFSEIFRIIIFDNGIEFRDINGIENSCLQSNTKRTRIFFAHPYRSNERAINENGNRLARKYFGKGSNFDKVSDKQI
jgi:IS30 family transposase